MKSVLVSSSKWVNGQFHLLALFAFFVITFQFSVLAISVPVNAVPFLDKVVHAAVYGLLAILLLQVMRRIEGIKNALPWAWIFAIIFGIGDEWHQAFVPGRYADFQDAVANTVGASLTLFLLWLRHRRRA